MALTPSFLRRTPINPGALLTVGTAAMVELAKACNVIRIGERQLERKLQRHKLQPERARLGEATVHYWDGGAGEGAPVVLLHGFGASAIWQWHGQVGPLARTRRVIVPDLLWFGQSRSPRRDFGIDHQIETVLALLDHLGIAKAHFVGISYGGIVAHELAAAHPHRVDKLALLDSPGRAYTPEDHRGMLERFAVRSASDLLLPRDTDGVGELLRLGYHRPPMTPRWVKRQVLETMYADFREEKSLLLSRLLEELEELEQRPGEVDHETLLIWGREDRVFPLEIGERLRGQLRNARLRVIDKAGHAPNIEHASLVSRWLLQFLGTAEVARAS